MEKYAVEKKETLEVCRRKVTAGKMSVEDALDMCKRHGIEDINNDTLIKG